jgi:hypothetical protein
MRYVNKKNRDQLTHNQPLLRSVAGSSCVLAAFLLLLSAPPHTAAQSYNFDSGTLSSDWDKYGVAYGLTYQITFPTVGNGKGLRLTSVPYAPLQYPGIAAIAVTNTAYDYTDFYLAVDMVNWTPNTNQSVVLLGRYSFAGGLAASSGMILNWDLEQDGDTTGDRYGGELQINSTAPGFATDTKATCQMTPVPGHSYRMIFKCVGQVYTGQVYDLADLTAPVVTLQFTDAGSAFTHGLCGLLSFDRSTGNTDVTFDNYYAAASDPNASISPAIMHSIPGTPVVETRSPAARYQNFYNPSSGISFTAKTHTADTIDSSATKLLLNGVDVSSQLSLTPSGGDTVLAGSLPASALKANSVYSAQLSLADTTGLKTSVNTFWFDTFSDAYLASASVKTIECEDYNYSNGVYQLDPIPVSGMTLLGSPTTFINGNGVGYYDPGSLPWMTVGTEGVDFHYSDRTTPDGGWDDYRANDNVRTGEGLRQEIEDELHMDVALSSSNPWDGFFNIYQRANDNTRQQYAASNIVEYLVIRTSAGDWFNYTRSFASSTTNYFAFLRAGAFYPANLTLSKVTSDPSLPSQTTSDYGSFSVPNGVRYANFSYIPLLDTNGAAPVLGLTGVNTLRLTKNGTVTKDNRTEVLNYLLLVPAQVSLQSASVVMGPYADEPTATVNVNARSVSIAATGATRFYRLQAAVPVKISGISAVGGTVTLDY